MDNPFYPDPDQRQYDATVRPWYEAAKHAYPNAVTRNGSSWSLVPDQGDVHRLFLVEYPFGNPQPIYHQTFACNTSHLCIACHAGYGDGICWPHRLRFTLDACWEVATSHGHRLDRFLDQHLVLKLTLLLVEALLLGFILLGVSSAMGANQQVITCGIIGMAVAYLAVSIMIIFRWHLRRMSEQADIRRSEDIHGQEA
jgi:hypothetical protein